MPAPFLVRSIRPNDGIRQLHVTLDHVQPNDVYFNVTPEVLKWIFPDDVREGDVWELQGRLLKRAGTNGLKKA